MNALELERVLAIVDELHPDHWPAGVQLLGERIEADQAWVVVPATEAEPEHQTTTALALVLVGRDPGDRPLGRADSPMRPRDIRWFEAEVERLQPLRFAFMEALNIEPMSGADLRQIKVEQCDLFAGWR
jgi:hypothetical protein